MSEEEKENKKNKEKKQNKESFVLDKKWFERKNLSFSGKRATIVAIYYSLPSNQNASGGTGSNVTVQKMIPWGEKLEPRIYVSPFSLKRKIRDYWAKSGEKVYYREDNKLIEDNEKEVSKNKNYLDFIDIDLFGYMKAKGGEKGSKGTQNIRVGPINSWGAVSIEPVKEFIDFNTSVRNVSENENMSIFNRQLSKDFYFTSFTINPDVIGVDFTADKHKPELKKERIKKFLEAMKYAMQKEGGPRDKPACVFLAGFIQKAGYPIEDKILLERTKMKENENKLFIKSMRGLDRMKVFETIPDFIEGEFNKTNTKDFVEELCKEE